MLCINVIIDHYVMLQALSVAVSIFGKWKHFEETLTQAFQLISQSSIATMQADSFAQPGILTLCHH